MEEANRHQHPGPTNDTWQGIGARRQSTPAETPETLAKAEGKGADHGFDAWLSMATAMLSIDFRFEGLPQGPF